MCLTLRWGASVALHFCNWSHRRTTLVGILSIHFRQCLVTFLLVAAKHLFKACKTCMSFVINKISEFFTIKGVTYMQMQADLVYFFRFENNSLTQISHHCRLRTKLRLIFGSYGLSAGKDLGSQLFHGGSGFSLRSHPKYSLNIIAF